MKMIDYLKASWNIKAAIENIIIIFLKCVELSIPALFCILFIKICFYLFFGN
jgi:hypothetical protein